MPLFKRKTDSHKLPGSDDSWNDWKNEIPPLAHNDIGSSGRGRRASGSAPRSILRNPSVNKEDDLRRHSIANAAASPRIVQGRDRFQSLPVSNSLSSISPSHTNPSPHALTGSSSLSRLNAKASDRDTDSGRVSQTNRKTSISHSRRPSLALGHRESGLSEISVSRSRSRSMSRARSLSRDDRPHDAHESRFPMPQIQGAIRELSLILRDRTKRFQLKDYLEPEEIVSGRIWEEEEETLVDCVRDRVNDEDGQDGVWRLERKSRQMKQKALRDKTQKHGNIFGARIQDLPTTSLSRVVIGGYTHIVPMVVNACVEELYRTGAYQPHLFRTLPNRPRLYDLVARFDSPAPANLTAQASGPTTKLYAKTPSLRSEQFADICALLVTYLSSLPDSLIHRSLCDGLWAWCVSPSIIRQEQRVRRSGDDDASESEYDTTEDEDEDAPSYNTRLRHMEFERLTLPTLKVQIIIAQHVLLLLPPRHFSLLVHLMTFFATLLVSPENGLSADDIARIFGPVVMARKHRTQDEDDSEQGAEQTRRLGDIRAKEKKTMIWLITHWERISAAYEAKHTRDTRRARSASVGEELEMRHRSSQGYDYHADGGSTDSATRGRRPEGYCQSEHTLSMPLKQREREDSQPQSAIRANNIHTGPYPPRPEPMTSGSTASSTPESEKSEIALFLSARQGKRPPKAPQSQKKVQIHEPDRYAIDSPDKEAVVSYHIEDSISEYSDDDILGDVVGRYFNTPEEKGVYTSSSDQSSVSVVPPDRAHLPEDGGVLEAENANLRRKLEEVLKERDEARNLVAVMRQVVHT